MRKSLLILAAAVMSATAMPAIAETVNGYTMTFDGLSASGSASWDGSSQLERDFVPGTGWSHIVKGGQSYFGGISYLNYSLYPTGGYNDSQYISIGSIYGVGNPGDALVTPPVSGTIKIQAEKTSNYSAPTLKFQKVVDDNGSLELGDVVYELSSSDIDANSFKELSFTVDATERLAIVGSNVKIDQFEASTAEVEKKRSLKIAAVAQPSTLLADADASGNFDVVFKTIVKNNGDYDLSSADSGYSVSLVDSADHSKVFTTTPINAALKQGQSSDSLMLSTSLNIKDYPSPIHFGIIENISGTYEAAATITPVPYIAKSSLTIDDKVISGDTTLNVGISKGELSLTLNLKNEGGAPLKVKSVSVPNGFKTNLQPTTIQPHQSVNVILTSTTDVTGQKKGVLEITTSDSTLKVNVAGVTVPETTWFADFEVGMPKDMYDVDNLDGYQGWTTSNVSEYQELANDSYCATASRSSVRKLVSPLINIADGETVSFLAAKKNSESVLNVYTSTNRKDWTLLKTINASGDNGAEKFSDELVGDSYDKNYRLTSFSVTPPAGQQYIAFETGNAFVDNILGGTLVSVPHDLVVQSLAAPTSGEINSAFTVSATIRNATLNREKGGVVKASLYLDGKLASETTLPQIEAGASTNISLQATPHKVGVSKVWLELSDASWKAKSDTNNINIIAEQAINEIQAGKIGFYDLSSYQPIDLNSDKTESEFVIPAEALSDLKEYDSISKLAFRGYSKSGKAHLSVYMAPTENGAYTSPYTPTSVDEMQPVFDGDYTFSAVGSVNDNNHEIMELPLTDKYIYDGSSILVHIISTTIEKGEANFQYDSNYRNYQIVKRDEGSFNSSAMPVVMIGVDKVAKILSGTVKSAEGNVLSGATVTITSGDVTYSATTDSKGKYSIDVIKDELSYAVSVSKAGYVPATDSVTVSENTTKSFSLATAKSLYIQSSSIPATATVNHPYNASVVVLNPLANDLKADEYKATLCVDGAAADSVATIAIKSMETANISFAYTPHEAGSHKVYVELRNGENTVTTQEQTLEVAEESLLKTVQAGDSTGTSYSYPVSLSAKESQSQFIYDPATLGIKPGTIIKSISFKGNFSKSYGSEKDYKAYLKVWLDNTTDNYENGFTERYLDGIEPDYADSVHVHTVGSTSNPVYVITIDLGDGFKYTGDNLRICFDFTQNDTYSGEFVVNGDKTNNGYQRNMSTYSDKLGDWSKANYLPVAWLSVYNGASVEGIIADSLGNAIKDATVRVQSGDVYYEATTDENGHYNVTVAQPELSYTATASAEGYSSATSDVEFTEGQAEVNIKLGTNTPNGISIIKGETFKSDGNVYTIDGRLASTDASKAKNLAKGLYIINGRKVVVK